MGVHTPEFAFEHVVVNVRAQAAALGVHYPVAIDDNYAPWPLTRAGWRSARPAPMTAVCNGLRRPAQVIGVVRTAHTELAATPIQAGLNRAGHGTLEIADRYREGLDGLADFDYAWLHRPRDPAGDAPLRQIPFLLRSQRRTMGIFATRGPRRVNLIGLSRIQLLQVTGQTVEFAGADPADGTPVIDLNPYVTPLRPATRNPRCGWFDQLTISDGTTPEQLARPESPT